MSAEIDELHRALTRLREESSDRHERWLDWRARNAQDMERVYRHLAECQDRLDALSRRVQQLVDGKAERVITFVVRLDVRDDGADDIESWPTITAYGHDQAPHPMPLVTGATKAAETAWDLVEAFLGHPAPQDQYEITIAAKPVEVDW